MNNNPLLSLLQLSDPMLPIGGYAHSAGLETYVQQDIVRDLTGAREFVIAMLTQNIRFTDGAFVSLAFNAARNNDWQKIADLDDACTAIKLPREIREASQKLGLRLLKTFQPVCYDTLAEKYRKAIQEEKLKGHYCLVFGIYAFALQVSKADALTGFYYNAAAGMVTNCVKLIPLGQQEGQEVLFSLQPLIGQLVQLSMEPDPSLLGLCCAAFDIRCMQHEELYSRQYMS